MGGAAEVDCAGPAEVPLGVMAEVFNATAEEELVCAAEVVPTDPDELVALTPMPAEVVPAPVPAEIVPAPAPLVMVEVVAAAPVPAEVVPAPAPLVLVATVWTTEGTVGLWTVVLEMLNLRVRRRDLRQGWDNLHQRDHRGRGAVVRKFGDRDRGGAGDRDGVRIGC